MSLLQVYFSKCSHLSAQDPTCGIPGVCIVVHSNKHAYAHSKRHAWNIKSTCLLCSKHKEKQSSKTFEIVRSKKLECYKQIKKTLLQHGSIILSSMSGLDITCKILYDFSVLLIRHLDYDFFSIISPSFSILKSSHQTHKIFLEKSFCR